MKHAVKITAFAMAFATGTATAEELTAPRNLIALPTAMVITDTVASHYPKVNGKANESLMRMICDLARGDKTQRDIDAILASNNVVPSSLQTEGNPLSLLVNGDKVKQQAACASWLASSLFSPMNNEAYKDIRKVSEPAPVRAAEETAKQSGKEGAPADLQMIEREEIVWNKEKFTNHAKVQLAVAKATAQFYALIANDVNREAAYSLSDLNRAVIHSIDNYAPEYLNAIKETYATLANSSLNVETLGQMGYSFSDKRGHVMMKNDSTMRLVWRGVTWLDQSTIMGKDYFVTINLNPVIEIPVPPEAEPKRAESKGKRKR